MKKLLTILLTASTILAFAQNPAVGDNPQNAILITNGTVHIGNGEVLKGDVLFQNGKIISVGEALQVPSSTELIDASNKHVYPGIISPYSTLGLNEIAAVRTTHDYNELGQVNPNIRAYIAHNTDSEVIPTVRGNGVLIGQTTPMGGLLPGKSGVLNYDGWNWEDAIIKAEDGLWLNWPSKLSRSYDRSTRSITYKKNKNYERDITTLETLFKEAQVYSASLTPNPKLSAVHQLWTSEMRLYIKVERARDIISALNFADNLDIENVVLVGVSEAETVLDILVDRNVPILIEGTHNLPDASDRDIWEVYKRPSKLMKAGLLVGMYYNNSYWRTRNLPFVAGTAAAFGLTKEEALKMITLNNAKILGVDQWVGSIEEGKMATLFISEGDVLDMKTARVSHAFINGKPVDLDDKQKRLNQKYKEKYGLK